ncbi:hypothetical protein E4U54_005120, partial [Claviceps lovelessii]
MSIDRPVHRKPPGPARASPTTEMSAHRHATYKMYKHAKKVQGQLGTVGDSFAEAAAAAALPRHKSSFFFVYTRQCLTYVRSTRVTPAKGSVLSAN